MKGASKFVNDTLFDNVGPFKVHSKALIHVFESPMYFYVIRDISTESGTIGNIFFFKMKGASKFVNDTFVDNVGLFKVHSKALIQVFESPMYFYVNHVDFKKYHFPGTLIFHLKFFFLFYGDIYLKRTISFYVREKFDVGRINDTEFFDI